MLKKWNEMGILKQIVFAIIASAITGIYFPNVGDVIKPLGEIVLRLIKMIIVPLIFFSIAKAVQ